MTALPPGFSARSAVDPILNVAPLPPRLQTVGSGSQHGQTRKKDEIDTLLSQGHLEHLYSHFLGSKRQQDNHDNKHPVWSVADSILRDGSDTNSIMKSPDGLTMSVNTCLRELATNINNVWNGSIFDKSLDYLLRILLRLHLAPERECRYWEGKRDAAIQKKCLTPAMSRKSAKKNMKSKIKRLCDDLSSASSPKKTERIISLLSHLGSQESGTTDTIKPLREQDIEEDEVGLFDDESDDEDEDTIPRGSGN